MQSNDVIESLQSPEWKLIEETTNGVLKCEGRIAGYQPIYLREGTFVNRLIAHVHNESIHLGVASTMSLIRENWWISQLRSKVKKLISNCNVCKVFSAEPFKAPTSSQLPNSAQLPEFRSTPERPFETTGVDFAGPLTYKIKEGRRKMLCNHIYLHNISGSPFRAGKITNRKRISRKLELIHH